MVAVGVSVLVAVGSVLALWLGARWLVDGAARLAAALGVRPLIVGLTIVAFGTSSPELVVSIGAALAGQDGVSVGNVVGSNVFNLGVILGVAAVIAPIRVREPLVRRDAMVMGIATVIAILVVVDLQIGRVEGLGLVALLVVYVGWLALVGSREPAPESSPARASTPADGRHREDATHRADAGRLLAGLLLVVVGGRLLVDAATTLALTAGLSEWTIGVTLVAAGTSMPELVTTVVAARRGEVGLAAGNVVGSNVFNLLGVLGFAALLGPMRVDPAAVTGLAWLLVLTAFATVLLATGRRLTRLEGVALVAAVAVYWAVGLAGL